MEDFMYDFELDMDGTYGGLKLMDGSKDEHERKFMNIMNFTDEMYELIQGEDGSGGGGSSGVSDGASNSQLGAAAAAGDCTDSIYEVGQSYRMVHGYISLLVCIAGIFMNILIIMVLTRKEMLTPINRMLTALAIADMLVMIEYIPFTLHMYIFELPEEQQYSYSWAVFVLFHSHFTQILHTINIQLTISMSIWRYVALKCSGKTSSYLTMSKVNICIILAYICPIIICIPNYLTFSIYHFERLYLKTPFHIILKRKEVSHMKNFLKLCEHTSEIMNIPMDCANVIVKQDWYTVGLSKLAKANNELLHRINFWIFSVFVKLIPCFILTFFMCWLVNALYKTKRRYKMLVQNAKQMTTTDGERLSIVTKLRRGRCNSAIDGENTSIMMKDIAAVKTHFLSTQQELREMANLAAPSSTISLQQQQYKEQQMNDLNEGRIEETNHLALCPPPRPSSSSFLCPPSPNDSILTMNGSCSSGTTPLVVLNNALPSQINNTTDPNVEQQQNGSTSKPQLPKPQPAVVCKRKFSRRNLTRVSSLRAISKKRALKQSSTATLNNHNYHHQQEAGASGAATSPPPQPSSFSTNYTLRNNSKKAAKRTDRTSRLLIAVLCLFLITEIPQGIMAFLSGIYGEQFFKKCYNPWAEVWDILALINSAINFILYCFMSKQFRLQFHLLLRIGRFFKPTWINNMANCNIHQTISTTV